MDTIERLSSVSELMDVVAVLSVVIGAIFVNTVLRMMLRLLLRRAAARSMQGRGRWVHRLPRRHDGRLGKQRRLQRADATAHMISRIGSLVIVGMVIVIVSGLIGVDPVVLVSSAGFVGAGIAVGGQAIIKDWLTGLLVLLEDRYAIGDQVAMLIDDREVSGTVETLSGAGVRLRLADGATWHVGHGSVDSVTNYSQQLVSQRIAIPPDVWQHLDQSAIGPALNAASHDLGLTDVVLVADIMAEADRQGAGSVTVLTSRPLNHRQQEVVGDRIAELGRR